MQLEKSPANELVEIIPEPNQVTNMTSAVNPIAERMDMVRWLIGAMMVGQVCGMRASASDIYQAVITLTKDVNSLNMCLAFSTALGGDGKLAKELSIRGFDDCANSDHLNLAMAHTLEMIRDPDWKLFAKKVVDLSGNKILIESAKSMLKNSA